MISKKIAKELSLLKWDALRKGEAIPPDIIDQIKGFIAYCPLCEIYNPLDCKGCPLNEAGQKCSSLKSWWGRWYILHYKPRLTPDEREKELELANQIYQCINDWKVSISIEEVVKFCCKYAEDFNMIDEAIMEVAGLFRVSVDNQLLWSKVYYPLLLQKTIEGINDHYKELGYSIETNDENDCFVNTLGVDPGYPEFKHAILSQVGFTQGSADENKYSAIVMVMNGQG